MSRNQSDKPTTFLPPDDVPSFGRRGGGGMTMPMGTGLVTRLVMGGFRIMFLGVFLKIIVLLGTMAMLFMFLPQIVGMVMGDDGLLEASSGFDRMTIVRWSWAMLKSSVIGLAED